MAKLKLWLQKHLVLSPQLLIALIPALSFFGGLIVLRASPNNLMPQLSDEVYYWHQAATFDRVGFEGGYYTADEKIAPAGTPFYAWGIGVPMFYGTVGSIFGWSLNSIPLTNLVIYTLGLFLFLAFVRLDKRSWLLLSVILLCYTPFIIYAPTSMIEIGQYGVAMIFGLVFVKLLQSQSSDKRISPIYVVAVFLFICAVGFIRLTWLFFLLPLALLWLRPKQLWQWALISVMMLVSILIIAFSFHRFSAPYPNSLTVLMEALRDDIGNGITIWISAIDNNLYHLSIGNEFETAQRLTILFLVVAVCALLFVKYWRTRSDPTARFDKTLILEVAIHLYNLMSIFTFQILFYEVYNWQGFRLLAPHVLLSVLLLAANRRWVILGAMSLIMLISLPMVYPEYRARYHYARQDRAIVAYQKRQAAFAPILQYDPDATSAWCNTVSHDTDYAYYDTNVLLAIEPGLSLSLFFDTYVGEFSAQYLLLTEKYVAEHGDRLSLEFLLEVPNGALYRNLSANC